jgi:type II secretory pathway pseudopilin PulG
MKAPRAAFTMIEIALSLAIIGFALVAIVGILPTGMAVQKDNREESVITLDEQVLMKALTSGAQGMDQLTNFVRRITIDITECNTNLVPIRGANHITVIMTATNGSTNVLTSYYGAAGPQYFPLLNGATIVGLLSTPNLVAIQGPPPIIQGVGNTVLGYVSNYITVDFNAMNGPAVDQGTLPGEQDLAFGYHVAVDNVRFSSIDTNSYATNFHQVAPFPSDNVQRSNNYVMIRSLQSALTEFRLRYSWPILPGAATYISPTTVGSGRQTYRSFSSGSMSTNMNVYFYTTQLVYPYTNFLYYVNPGVYQSVPPNIVLWR